LTNRPSIFGADSLMSITVISMNEVMKGT